MSGPSTSPMLCHEITSQTPQAVYQRHRYLHEDGFGEKVAASRKKHTNRKKQKALVDRNAGLGARKTMRVSSRLRLIERIKFHLSKSRDVGDIAVRECIQVSLVNSIIAEMGKITP